jgi:hypothetical protein
MERASIVRPQGTIERLMGTTESMNVMSGGHTSLVVAASDGPPHDASAV